MWYIKSIAVNILYTDVFNVRSALKKIHYHIISPSGFHSVWSLFVKQGTCATAQDSIQHWHI